MEKNLRFFGRGVLVLSIVILGIWFVMAATNPSIFFEQNTTNDYDAEGNFNVNWTEGGNTAIDYVIYYNIDGGGYTIAANDSDFGYTFSNSTEGNYTFIVEGENVTNVKTNSSLVWMIVDTTDPAVSYTTGTPDDNTAANRDWINVTVSVTEANEHTITFELYNSTALVTSTSFTDLTRTINFTGLPINVAYSYNVTVNDSATRSVTTATRTFTLDNVKPSVSLTESSSGQTSLELSISGAEGTCTVDRSGATISGSTLTETGLSCDNSYIYIVTCTDTAGNVGSSSATSFTTDSCGGGTTIPQPKQKTHSWSKITPGTAVIMKDFDSEIGIKQIQIEVNNEAQSVKITVTKYDDKPAAVTISKTGKVYKYLQIETTNLADKLGKATVTLQVGKSWLSSNNLDARNIALFRFDESAGQWNELATSYVGSEGDNELYDVELTSFSFFAVSEKSAVEAEGAAEGAAPSEEQRTNLVWLWVVIAILVLVLIGWGMKKRAR